MRFAIIGLGYISSRHIKAIKAIGGKIVVGCDIDERTKEKLPKGTPFVIDYQLVNDYNPEVIVICTPNYLHFEMCQYFKDKIIICEKPLTIGYELCDKLSNNVNVVHQLRYDKKCIRAAETRSPKDVLMKINIHRGDWYFNSWKNDPSKSGGLLYNIGVHYFDLLRWFLGDDYRIIAADIGERRAQGVINFDGVNVRWELSLNAPLDKQERFIYLDNYKLNLSRNFEKLHIEVYKQILAGNGIKPRAVKKTLLLIDQIINFK